MARYALFLVLCITAVGCGEPSTDPSPAAAPSEVPVSVVSFTFDDGHRSIYDVALPIMTTHEAPATAYIVTGLMNTEGFMSVQQLRTLKAHGWEIGSHSVTHPRLTERSRQRVFRELYFSMLHLRVLGFDPVSFATPYGLDNETIRTIIMGLYQSNRGTKLGDNVPLSLGDLRICIQLDHLQGIDGLRSASAAMNNVLDHGGWAIFYGHQVGEDGCDPLVLDGILNICREEGVSVLTIREALGI